MTAPRSKIGILVRGSVCGKGMVTVGLSRLMGGGSDRTPGVFRVEGTGGCGSAGGREPLQSWQDGGEQLLAGR